MEVVPAIDLRGGRCVRLYQGDYAQETVYSEDPLEVAQRWVGQGAPRLHVVDLDGARSGRPENLEALRRIAASVPAPVQVGGGIRSVDTAEALVSAGVQRVIIGTAAVEDPGLVETICDKLGAEAVVVGVDARDGYVAVKGWTENSRIRATDLVRRMSERGVRRMMYTDIARDGTLTEPNFHAVQALVGLSDMNLIAAGGISSVDHLQRFAQMGVEATVVGKAIYTGDIQLSRAIEAVNRHSRSLE